LPNGKVHLGAVTSYPFNSITADHTISASFAPDITYVPIIASAGRGGTISPSGVIQVPQGSNLNFSIVPNSNYNIKNVLVDGNSMGPLPSCPLTNIVSPHSILASFIAQTFTILPDRTTLKIAPEGTAQFKVKLSDNPYADVTVSVARLSGNPAITVQGGATLVFTANNWDTYQTVTLAASMEYMYLQASAIFEAGCTGMTPCQVKATRGYSNSIPAINLLLGDEAQ
jgi:hypothetical protein